MKSSHLRNSLVAIFVLLSVLSAVALEPEPKEQFGTKYVFVTASRIPDKVKVKSVGTATISPMDVIKYGEIQQSGRLTTERVLALDPSVRIFLGRAGSGL
jgi:hypothetical protein